MVDAQLEDRARRIPSQGGVEIADTLRRLAAETPDGHAIVEVGVWLGAGTAQLALGLLGRAHPPEIHAYDRFEASRREAEKAAAFGVRLRPGQDTTPVVRDLLRPFGAPVRLHRGNLLNQSWTGGPIGLYVDDASKAPHVFNHVLRTFGPSWAPGVTALVLMDYTHFQNRDGERAEALRCQHDFISAHPAHFKPIPDADACGTTAAFFRYAAPFDFAALPVVPPPDASFARRVRRSFRRFFAPA